MILEEVLTNMNLPARARVDRRVPKKLVVEHSPALRRKAIREGIEKLQWVAALKPENCAIPAGVIPQAILDKPTIDQSPVKELSILALEARPEARLPTVLKAIHEAIPYLVLLLATQNNHLKISIAWKRPSLSEPNKSVLLKDPAEAPPIDMASPVPLDFAFLDALSLGTQPERDLAALYRRWEAALFAAHVATVTGSFELIRDPEGLETRQELLNRHSELSKEIPSLARQLKRATQMRDQVDLSSKIKQAETELARLIIRLNHSR